MVLVVDFVSKEQGHTLRVNVAVQSGAVQLLLVARGFHIDTWYV